MRFLLHTNGDLFFLPQSSPLDQAAASRQTNLYCFKYGYFTPAPIPQSLTELGDICKVMC